MIRTHTVAFHAYLPSIAPDTRRMIKCHFPFLGGVTAYLVVSQPKQSDESDVKSRMRHFVRPSCLCQTI